MSYIRDRWNEFETLAVPPDTPHDQRAFLRSTFFAGAAFAAIGFVRAVNVNKQFRFVSKLLAEVEDFANAIDPEEPDVSPPADQ